MNRYLTLYRLLAAPRRRQLLVTAGLMLVGAAAEVLTIGAVLPFIALVADRHSRLVEPGFTAFLDRVGGSPVAGAALLLIAAAVASAAVRLLLARKVQKLVMGIGHDLAAALFGRAIRQPYSLHVRRNSSHMLASVDEVQRVVFNVLLPGVQGIVAAVIAAFLVALLFVIQAMAALLAAAALAVAYLGVSFATRARLRRNAAVLAEAAPQRLRIVQEALGGIRDIILDGSEPLFEQAFEAADRRYRHVVASNLLIATSPRFVIEAAGIVGIALVALAMSLAPGGIVAELPVLGALALAAQRLLPLLQTAYHGWTQVSGNRATLDKLLALMRAPGPAAPVRALPAAPADFARAIEFDSVGYHYPEGRFALRGVSLRIDRGRRIGITGPSGSGKSTLLDLLMGLLPPDEGEIRIDGRLLGPDSLAGWQSRLAHVPQAIHLIDNSIAANIAFPQPAASLDPARLDEAVETAELKAWLAQLPDGLDTRVGERGIRLSGGQRQRIGIARAVYRRAPVLILDEATSALDEAAETAVLAALARRGATLVMIAHRASTLAGCDTIVRLGDGMIVDVEDLGRAIPAKAGAREQ